MAPTLLIATRFGLGIKDPRWFEHRLLLLSAITAPSLLAQDDQQFEWVVFIDRDVPNGVRQAVEEILAPFNGRAFINNDGHNADNLLAIARTRDVGGFGGVLTGRIDDDDAWDTKTVGLVRERVESWIGSGGPERGLACTFENGVVWTMYDMVDIDHLNRNNERVVRRAAVRPYDYPFISISGFVYAPEEVGVTSISAGHARIPEVAERSGLRVDAIATNRPMWLYCRHKQAQSPIHRASRAEEVSLSLAQLAKQFGIDPAETEAYIARAAGFGYDTVMRHFEQRAKVRRAMRELRAAHESGQIERHLLEKEEGVLRLKLSELSTNIVNDEPSWGCSDKSA